MPTHPIQILILCALLHIYWYALLDAIFLVLERLVPNPRFIEYINTFAWKFSSIVCTLRRWSGLRKWSKLGSWLHLRFHWLRLEGENNDIQQDIKYNNAILYLLHISYVIFFPREFRMVCKVISIQFCIIYFFWKL